MLAVPGEVRHCGVCVKGVTNKQIRRKDIV